MALKFKGLRFHSRAVVGKDNKIINFGVVSHVKYDIIGNENIIEIDNGVILSNLEIYIRGDNHKLIIGENCRIKSGRIWFKGNSSVINMGENTTVENSILLAAIEHKNIYIGKDCMFSDQIELRTGDSHSIIDSKTRKRNNFAKDIIIGNHVWIGTRCVILKGVNIGDNSIVAASSLVSKSVPSNVIAAGVPAKVIKKNVDWLRKRI